MMTTQQQDTTKQIADAVLQQAIDAGYASSIGADASDSQSVKKGKSKEKQGAVSPRSGAVLPQGTGRPVGVKNKLTNLREAVLEAFDQVGGAQYLAKLAQGTSSDRAAFVGLVSKVLPTQINANVEGGIQVQLSWLGQRNIGTTTAQPVEQVTQVVDLERDSAGKYRIKDPVAEGDGTGPTNQSGVEGPQHG